MLAECDPIKTPYLAEAQNSLASAEIICGFLGQHASSVSDGYIYPRMVPGSGVLFIAGTGERIDSNRMRAIKYLPSRIPCPRATRTGYAPSVNRSTHIAGLGVSNRPDRANSHFAF